MNDSSPICPRWSDDEVMERLFVRLEDTRCTSPDRARPRGRCTPSRARAAARGRLPSDGVRRHDPGWLRDPRPRAAGRRGAAPRLRGRVEGFSIALRPGAAGAILGVPAGELTERAASLDALWRGGASDLQERIAGVLDDEARVRGNPDAGARAAARAVRVIAASGGQRSLRDVARELGIGERRLHQLFHAPSVCRRARGAVSRACTTASRAAPITPTELLRRSVSGSSKTAPGTRATTRA